MTLLETGSNRSIKRLPGLFCQEYSLRLFRILGIRK